MSNTAAIILLLATILIVYLLRHTYLRAKAKRDWQHLYKSECRDGRALRLARQWQQKRTEELLQLWHEFDPIKIALKGNGLFNEQFIHMQENVGGELRDYLTAIDKDPIGWARTHSLHNDGPFTTVPTHPTGWMTSAGNQLLDAHIELLIAKGKNTLALLEANKSNNEREQQYQEAFKLEIDKAVDAAGLNNKEFCANAFNSLNKVREVSTFDYCRFTESPLHFHLLSDVLDHIEVAEYLPDAGIYFAAIVVDPSERTISGCMDNFHQAQKNAWKPLSEDEKGRVLLAFVA